MRQQYAVDVGVGQRVAFARDRIALSISTKKARNPKSEAMKEKVRLMKMKMKATGAERIPQEHRFYLCVSWQGQPGAMYFIDDRITVGRAVDELCKLSKQSNHNNNPAHAELAMFTLHHQKTALVRLPFSSVLCEIPDLVCSGAEVFLELVDRS